MKQSLIRPLNFQLSDIDGLNNDSIRNSLSGWKTTALFLNESNNIIRLIFLMRTMPERDQYTMIDVVQILYVKSFDKP